VSIASEELHVLRAAEIREQPADEPSWLVEPLWGAGAVGIIGGAPKSCLCRARHKQLHPARRIMPRQKLPPAGFSIRG
jgi:hypothetical protein